MPLASAERIQRVFEANVDLDVMAYSWNHNMSAIGPEWVFVTRVGPDYRLFSCGLLTFSRFLIESFTGCSER